VHVDVVHVKESGFLEADIDECGLHPGQNPGYTAFIDISDDSFSGRPLDQKLLDLTILEEGDPSFGERRINNKLSGHAKILFGSLAPFPGPVDTRIASLEPIPTVR
jgi:hypothetical protein